MEEFTDYEGSTGTLGNWSIWSKIYYHLGYFWYSIIQYLKVPFGGKYQYNTWFKKTTQEKHSEFVQYRTDQFNKTGKKNCVINENGLMNVEADRMANGGEPPKWTWILWLLLFVWLAPWINKYIKRWK